MVGRRSGQGAVLEKPHVFLTLDALRGVAALAVVAFHTAGFFGKQAFPHGYLAVDFFFMLSGFVIAYAYQKKLDEGWSTASFMKARLIRLYPLYLVGLLLGIVFRFLPLHSGTNHFSGMESAALILLGLLILPAPPLRGHDSAMFPFNTPSWSLHYEILANLLHALLLRRRNVASLVSTCTISAVAILYSTHHLGTMDFGLRSSQFVYGISRVIFSYTAGILSFLVWKSRRIRIHVPPTIIIFLLLILLAIPANRPSWIPYDLLITMFLFPSLLLLGAASQPAQHMVSIFKTLGTLSYAIYVLHVPLSQLFGLAWGHFRGQTFQHDAPWSGAMYLVLVLSASWFLNRFYDLRARAFLRGRLVFVPKHATVTVR